MQSGLETYYLSHLVSKKLQNSWMGAGEVKKEEFMWMCFTMQCTKHSETGVSDFIFFIPER